MHRRTVLAAALLWASTAAGLSAQTTIDRWLVLGPTAAHAPALAVGGDTTLLEASGLRVDGRWPAAGERVNWLAGQELRWEEQRAGGDGNLALQAASGPAVAYATAYLESDRWQRARLHLDGSGVRRAWLDGRRVEGETMDLPSGKHWLLVEAVRSASTPGPWRLAARLEPLTAGGRISVSLDPRHEPTWAELHSIPEVSDIRIDPASQRVAWVVRGLDPVNDRWVSHIEVRGLGDGRLVAELRPGAQAGSPRWSRDGRRLAFTTPTDAREGEGSDLWVWDPAAGGARRLLRAEAGLGDVQWSEDGAWIYFTATVRDEPRRELASGEATRLTEVWERWSFWPEKSHLFALNVEQGTRLKLAGDVEYGVAGPTLSPDGRKIVFNRNVRFAERPFLRSELWLLDLPTMQSRKLMDLTQQAFAGPETFAWSPDSRAIAFCASAQELLREPDPEFSVYETELFATPIDQPRLVHLSEGFVPAVGVQTSCQRVHWSERDNHIYVAVDQGARSLPARTRAPVTGAVETTTLEVMPIPGEVMDAYDFGGEWLVASVETPVTPGVVQRIRLGTSEATVLHAPAADELAQVEMPTWEPWDFTDSEGRQIEGWYWLPPNFDPARKYPMIVHYYGGTIPMKKEFETRLLWLASNGYVVYMLNPAGTPGYGQEFANQHINDWGFPAATDIIEGVQKFTAAHPFVDAERIGNFGHSYGGFMTMHLLTRTDLFAAGIELAGISNIANYWGAGWTGYSYTEGTCPGCFPWNRPDVYVDRSPLFQADRIETPLLLIHGTGDTNVVPTESEQMFTALRGLGREAELVRFEGENHGINSRPSVQHDRDAIMLYWYDRYLKGQPQAWTARWEDDPSRQSATSTLPGR